MTASVNTGLCAILAEIGAERNQAGHVVDRNTATASNFVPMVMVRASF